MLFFYKKRHLPISAAVQSGTSWFFRHQNCPGFFFWKEASTFCCFFFLFSSAKIFQDGLTQKALEDVQCGLNSIFSGIISSRGTVLLAVKIATNLPKTTWAVPFCPYCSWDQPEKPVQWAFPLSDDFCSNCLNWVRVHHVHWAWLGVSAPRPQRSLGIHGVRAAPARCFCCCYCWPDRHCRWSPRYHQRYC